MWQENEAFWQALDDLTQASAEPLNDMLSELHKHKKEISPMMRALLFGGFGKFILKYNELRAQKVPNQDSFVISLQYMMEDKRMSGLMQQAVNNQVDSRVEAIKNAEN